MGVSWIEARDGAAWSLSGIMHDQPDAHDDEGRPLGEVRAASRAKDGVAMVLSECPYKDERNGRAMNVSALEQISRHLKAVLRDMEAFRTPCGERPDSWWHVMECILDQLTGPARFLLTERAPVRPIPATLAVGHKLAAGYFGVVRTILEEEALGKTRPVKSAELLTAVREQKALLGLSEVCAGPPNMIRKVTEVLLGPLGGGLSGRTGSNTRSNAARLESPWQRLETRAQVARLLGTQLALGLSFKVFDAQQEKLFFQRFGDVLEAKNVFFGKRLSERRQEVSALAEVPRDAAARASSHDVHSALLRQALKRGPRAAANDDSASEAAQCLAGFLSEQRGALVAPAGRHLHLAIQVEHYLVVLAYFTKRQWQLEMEIRSALGLPTQSPVRQSALQRPLLRTLDWYEALLGRKSTCDPAPQPVVSVRVLGQKRPTVIRVEDLQVRTSLPSRGVSA